MNIGLPDSFNIYLRPNVGIKDFCDLPIPGRSDLNATIFVDNITTIVLYEDDQISVVPTGETISTANGAEFPSRTDWGLPLDRDPDGINYYTGPLKNSDGSAFTPPTFTIPPENGSPLYLIPVDIRTFKVITSSGKILEYYFPRPVSSVGVPSYRYMLPPEISVLGSYDSEIIPTNVGVLRADGRFFINDLSVPNTNVRHASACRRIGMGDRYGLILRDSNAPWFWSGASGFTRTFGQVNNPKKVVMTPQLGAVILNFDGSLAFFDSASAYAPYHNLADWSTAFSLSDWNVDGSPVIDIFSNDPFGQISFLLGPSSLRPYQRIAYPYRVPGPQGPGGGFHFTSELRWIVFPQSNARFASGWTEFYIASKGQWSHTKFLLKPGPPNIKPNQIFGGRIGRPFPRSGDMPPPGPPPNNYLFWSDRSPFNMGVTASITRVQLESPVWCPVISFSGSLPAGLAISPDGTISGSPLSLGDSLIPISVQGLVGADTESVRFQVGVGDPIVAAGQSFVGKVSESFSASIQLTDPILRPATSWAVRSEFLPGLGLPPGLFISNGQIQGTPTTVGNWIAKVSATGPNGVPGEADVAISISAGPPIVVGNQSASGVVGQLFGKTFSLIDSLNRPSTSWQISGLPGWASYDASTGNISGTPLAVGIHAISLIVTGPGGISNLATATITIVAGAPILDANQSFAGKVGELFSATRLTMQDPVNRAPAAWAAVGVLPPGLSLDVNTGIISGSPTMLGAFTALIRASNSSGQSSVNVSFAITAGVPLTAGSTKIEAAVGLPFSRLLVRQDLNNRPITSFSAAGLPAWMSFDSATGKFSGTPAAIGTFNFTITATGPGGQSVSSVEINVGAGVGYYELRDADTGKIYVRTLARDFVVANLQPETTYNLELRAWNGGGVSAPQAIQVTTLPLSGRPSNSDRLRILPVTEKFTDSSSNLALPASVASPDSLMKNVWVKKTTPVSAQFSANSAAFNGGFIRGEDVIEADWLIDGLPTAQYDRGKENLLLTEEAPFSFIRHETPNFISAYSGEYIDGNMRQTVIHARINTTDSFPSQWFAEAYLQPNLRLRLHVLFYTNMFNTVLRVGGPTLHFGSFKVPNTLEAQAARTGEGLRQIVNVDGSQTFVRAVIDCGEDEHAVFLIKNIGGMRDTQTSLVVVSAR